MMGRLQEIWRKAGITNDFIFGNVMQMGNNCRDLLRAILPELNIQQAHFVNTQKDVHDQHDRKGVRMDVFAEDDVGRAYDIEMQVADEHNLGPRIRYYQSKIDTDSLRSGASYQDIKPSYVIFLCAFDPFECGLRRYDFQWQCKQNPDIILPTKSQAIILNSKGIRGQVTEELDSFFALMNGQEAADDFGRQIAADVARVKADPVKKGDFMEMAMKISDAKRAGMRAGIRDGRVEMAERFAQQLKQDGNGEETIRQNLKHFYGDKLSNLDVDRIMKSIE